MRNLIIIVAFLFVASSRVAFAGDTTLSVETAFAGTPCVSVYSANAQAFVFAQVATGWAQAYAGMKYSPAPWAEVSLGIGLEQADSPFRVGGSVWLGQGRVSALHLFEDGGSGPWHKTTVAYKATSELSLGLVDRSFCGRGLTAEYKLSNDTTLTVAAYNSGQKTAALSYSF